MGVITDTLKAVIDRRTRLAYTIPEFTSKHKELLIIVCDPKTDEIYVTYNNKIVRGKIGDKEGKEKHIVKTVLKYGRFPTVIDKFLLELQSAMQAYHRKGRFLFTGIYDALYSVARANTKSPNGLKKVDA